jgi:hypothetical protein
METDQLFNSPLETQGEKSIDNPHKYYREHAVQYVFLVLAFIFSIIILMQLGSVFWKLVTISALSALYLVFGIWHHLEEKNLTSRHTLEYLLISAIVFVVLISIFL